MAEKCSGVTERPLKGIGEAIARAYLEQRGLAWGRRTDRLETLKSRVLKRFQIKQFGLSLDGLNPDMTKWSGLFVRYSRNDRGGMISWSNNAGLALGLAPLSRL